ncbi:hypothetical protein CC86DRAFT_403723 [Ophiobolus disseminans]|uniref:Uncharacterized protein n=1 Tax=Ophiobolus disseminans TaxID=1469910 RepID=A0A6A7A7C7_9PLEO|nr:hypothetical protein CC86DRAFT_403723 [Ophiobolus disseminans]
MQASNPPIISYTRPTDNDRKLALTATFDDIINQHPKRTFKRLKKAHIKRVNDMSAALGREFERDLKLNIKSPSDLLWTLRLELELVVLKSEVQLREEWVQMNSEPKKVAFERPSDSSDISAAPDMGSVPKAPMSTISELPQCPKPYNYFSPGENVNTTPSTTTRTVPVMGTFRMPPAFQPPMHQPVLVTRRECETSAPSHKPAIYDWEGERDVKLAELAGTSAYYKSREFKKMKLAKSDQVPGRRPNASKDITEGDNTDVEMADREATKPQSLILIFGRTTVRRARTNDKFYLRMQRYNKRTKAWRRISGEEAMFEWD